MTHSVDCWFNGATMSKRRFDEHSGLVAQCDDLVKYSHQANVSLSKYKTSLASLRPNAVAHSMHDELSQPTAERGDQSLRTHTEPKRLSKTY